MPDPHLVVFVWLLCGHIIADQATRHWRGRVSQPSAWYPSVMIDAIVFAAFASIAAILLPWPNEGGTVFALSAVGIAVGLRTLLSAGCAGILADNGDHRHLALPAELVQTLAPPVAFWVTLLAFWPRTPSLPENPEWIAIFCRAEVLKTLLAITATIWVWFGGALFMKSFLDSFLITSPADEPEYDHQLRLYQIPQAGKRIGQLERVLIMILAIAGQYTAISFVVAAKSIARHKDLERRTFAEYYLIGTLMSVTLAVVVGLGVRLLFDAIDPTTEP